MKSFSTFLFASFFLSCVNSVYAQNLKLDQSMGQAGFIQVQQSIGIYNDENLEKYITAIGNKLVKHLGEQPFKYHFYVIDMAEPNAFALPGGYIFVSRGILALTNTEDELACIIGHEIMHVHKRHSVQQQKKSLFPTIIQIPGAVVGSVAGESIGNIVGAPAALTAGLIVNTYSRAHETEADELGTTLAAAAGYNPKAMPAVLNRLHLEVNYMEGKETKFSYFDSHPYTPDRVSNLTGMINQGKIAPPSKPSVFLESADYKSLYNGMPFDTNPAAGILIDSLFLHPELNFKMTLPSNWKTANMPVALMSISKNQSSQLKIEAVGDSLTPQEWGQLVQEEVYKHKKLKANKAQLVKLDDRDGYYLNYQVTQEQTNIDISLFWWQVEGTIIQLSGISRKFNDPDIWNTITSFSKIEQKDDPFLATKQFKAIESIENESIDDFHKRTNSVIPTELIAIINGLNRNEGLKSGMKIKTAQRNSISK